MPELLRGSDAAQVAGIGAGGQMHGLVALDENDEVIRPAILWNDGRTAAQVGYLNNAVGREKLGRYTANIAFAGFTAPKLLWMRENEPELFAGIRRIMLPKDYINYRLTGVHCTDYFDASGMLLLGVERKRWSREMLDVCGISEAQLPRLFESWETVGTLLPDAAERLGRNPVFFLPYLMGERSPINDTDARGTLVGMRMDTSRADLTQAVLEGVAFAIRDSFEVAKALGPDISRSTLCGGGSKSPLWRTILANVLGIPLDLPQTEQGPGYGGAMLAMVACGAFDSVPSAAGALVRIARTVEPEPEITARYEKQYQKFRAIYPALKSVFPILK